MGSHVSDVLHDSQSTSSDNNNDVVKIEDVQPSLGNAWKIHGKIINILNIKPWESNPAKNNTPVKTGKIFKFTLKDETGTILITAFNENAEDLKDIIALNKTISFENGKIKDAYCNQDHPFEITCTRNTRVKEIPSNLVRVELL